MRRFYINPETIRDDTATIEGSDARHIKKVLRLKPGMAIVVFDGTGHEYEAVITDIAMHYVQVGIQRQKTAAADPLIRITVAQGLLKDRKMDVLVRQLTELGISRWIPFSSSRSIPSPSNDRFQARMERWRKISAESLKQCRRNIAPVIEPLHSFSETLSAVANMNLKLFFWENADAPVPCSLPNAPKEICIMMGPEGGFSRSEYDAALSTGFAGASLGPRILKAETAPIAACAIVQYLFGDVGIKNLDKGAFFE